MHTPTTVRMLMRRYRGSPRGRAEGDLHIMGTLHIDRAAHHSALYELHHADAQDPSCTRDRIVHLCRYVERCLPYPRPTS